MRLNVTRAVTMLVVALAMSAIAAASASAAKTGPHWTVESKELASGQAKKVDFNGGETEMQDNSTTFDCRELKGSGELKGGSPGTGKTTVEFEGCSVKTGSESCTFKIKEQDNAELVYDGTEAQIREETSPLGLLLKTSKGKEKVFGQWEASDSGFCEAFYGPLDAVGKQEHGPGIEGITGLLETIATPESSELSHELNSPNPRIQTFFYWEGGAVDKGTVGGLEFNTNPVKQIGSMSMSLTTKEKFAATGR
jgi:hypothetical protein